MKKLLIGAVLAISSISVNAAWCDDIASLGESMMRLKLTGATYAEVKEVLDKQSPKKDDFYDQVIDMIDLAYSDKYKDQRKFTVSDFGDDVYRMCLIRNSR